MLRKITYLVIIVMFVTIVGGCTSDVTEGSTGLGQIRFTINVEDATADVKLIVSDLYGQYSHAWSNANDFPEHERFYVGDYRAIAYTGEYGKEGYNCPCYFGDKTFTVTADAVTNVSIDCTLSQAIISAHIASTSADYTIEKITLHASGYGYIDITENNANAVYIMPGSTEVMVTLSDGYGGTVSIAPGFVFDTSAGKNYDLEVDIDEEHTLSLRCGDASKSMVIDSGIFDSEGPRIDCMGFVSGGILILTEGFPAAVPVQMHVTSDTPLQAITLTASGIADSSFEVHTDIELLKYGQDLVDQGLVIDKISDNEVIVDFTTILENIHIDNSAMLRLTLQAQDIYGRVSNIAELRTDIECVKFDVLYKSSAWLGLNIATLTMHMNVPEVDPKDFNIRLNDGTELEITSSKWDEINHNLTLQVLVPEGISTVPIEIDYLGTSRLKLDIEREVPDYEIHIDAFATMARIHLKGNTEAVTSTLTKYARLSANGRELAVLTRDEEQSLIVVTGLEPDTRYTIESHVIDGGFVASSNIVTEKAEKVPSGDFEDFVDYLKYDHLASGGIYSSTSFPIFNQQNLEDVNVSWTRKHWASTNEKTFCRDAKRHNTWYMQPSAAIDFTQAAGGSKSMMVMSVGWSLDGEDIEPYVQSGDNFVPYNCNAPRIDNVSAGCAFLGSYKFDSGSFTETYNEGVGFGSRPQSLNGFYRYVPDKERVDDRGLLTLQIVNDDTPGNEIVIADAYIEFGTAPDFRSFNIPLTYYYYNIPAKRLKIMFMSSKSRGEPTLTDPDVPVSADLPNARYIGSTLWIDNLTFSY